MGRRLGVDGSTSRILLQFWVSGQLYALGKVLNVVIIFWISFAASMSTLSLSYRGQYFVRHTGRQLTGKRGYGGGSQSRSSLFFPICGLLRLYKHEHTHARAHFHIHIYTSHPHPLRTLGDPKRAGAEIALRDSPPLACIGCCPAPSHDRPIFRLGR